jgi:hypothetical protein
MSNKNKIAEISKKIKVMEAALAAKAKKPVVVKETAAPKSGIAYLIESELEKAEVLLVAKSVVEKLQKTAEDLAKIDGTDIMPAMEGLKAAFGPEDAIAFQQAAADALRNAVNGISAAKDAISAHVAKFEGALNGETNDMATFDDAAVPADPAADAAAPAPAGDDLGAEAPEADMGAEAPAADDAEMGELDGMFDDAGTDTAAGRPKKESFAPGAKALKEAKDPDAVVLAAFRRLLSESKNKPVPAAKAVARHFGIDFADVVAIVSENARGK